MATMFIFLFSNASFKKARPIRPAPLMAIFFMCVMETILPYLYLFFCFSLWSIWEIIGEATLGD